METNFKTATLRKAIVHYIGSKNNLEPLHLSKKEIALDEETLQIIGESFLSRFNNVFEKYCFHHPSSLQFNEVYNYASEILFNKEEFADHSASIAQQLYESSAHPKVKAGELYVCLFEGLPVESRVCSAIGLFKTENKSLFLEVENKGKDINVQMKEGMELTKIDKGCLIINNNRDEGFDVLIFDNQNRGEEAQFWKQQFLNLTPQKNEFQQTQHFLTLTKQFITEQMDSELGVPRQEQINLLSKSIDYFKTKENFDINEFQSEVFADEEHIEAFRSFGSLYTAKHEVDILDSFPISAPAVKKQNRVYKSVLKLDKNFHIYIHGNTDLIEKGVDENGRKWYKIYYQEEA